jgi:hypothetical protein
MQKTLNGNGAMGMDITGMSRYSVISKVSGQKEIINDLQDFEKYCNLNSTHVSDKKENTQNSFIKV